MFRVSLPRARAGVLPILLGALAPLWTAAEERCPELASLKAQLRKAGDDDDRALSLLRTAVVRTDSCASLPAMLELQRRRDAILPRAFPSVQPADLDRDERAPGMSFPYGLVLAGQERWDEVVPALVLEARYLASAAEIVAWRTYQLGLGAHVAPLDARLLAMVRELASDGVPRGELWLGMASRRGLGVPKDAAQAERWLGAAAPALDEAKVELGWLRLDQQRFGDARALFEEILQRAPDDGGAMTGLGAVFLRAPAPAGSCARARALLDRAAHERHEPAAQVLLARAVLEQGADQACLQVDPAAAAQDLRAAVQAGHPEALRLAQTLQKPRFSPATIAGWREGCDRSGRARDCYEYGVYLAQDRGEEPAALPYYEKACAGGEAMGCFNLAGLLVKDRSTRAHGIQLFEQVCGLAAPEGDEVALQQQACHAAEVVRTNRDLDYPALSRKLVE